MNEIATITVLLIRLPIIGSNPHAFDAIPEIVNNSVPRVIQFANEKDIDLPFDDLHSLRDQAVLLVRNQLGYLGNFAKIATKETAFLIIGLVVAISIFLNPTLDLDRKGMYTNR